MNDEGPPLGGNGPVTLVLFWWCERYACGLLTVALVVAFWQVWISVLWGGSPFGVPPFVRFSPLLVCVTRICDRSPEVVRPPGEHYRYAFIGKLVGLASSLRSLPVPRARSRL